MDKNLMKLILEGITTLNSIERGMLEARAGRGILKTLMAGLHSRHEGINLALGILDAERLPVEITADGKRNDKMSNRRRNLAAAIDGAYPKDGVKISFSTMSPRAAYTETSVSAEEKLAKRRNQAIDRLIALYVGIDEQGLLALCAQAEEAPQTEAPQSPLAAELEAYKIDAFKERILSIAGSTMDVGTVAAIVARQEGIDAGWALRAIK